MGAEDGAGEIRLGLFPVTGAESALSVPPPKGINTYISRDNGWSLPLLVATVRNRSRNATLCPGMDVVSGEPASPRAWSKRDVIVAAGPGSSVALHLPTGTYLELDATATEIVHLVSELGQSGAAAALAVRYGLEADRATADVARVVNTVRGGGMPRAATARRPTAKGTLSVVRSWARLPRRARRATSRATILIIAIDVALRVWPVDLVADRLGVPLAIAHRDPQAPPLDHSRLTGSERLQLWAVGWVLDRWLFDATCLRRSLAWGRVLRGRGPELCIGLLEDGSALAHAWLHFGDATLDAPDQVRHFSAAGAAEPMGL